MTPKILTQRIYRSTFGTPDGQRCLAHLLIDMGHFSDHITDPGDVAVANYAKTLLKRCALAPDKLEDAPRAELVIQHLFEMPYEEE